MKETGYLDIKIEPIGENVWERFVQYCEQVIPEQDWSQNWIKVYKEDLLDYYIVTAIKN